MLYTRRSRLIRGLRPGCPVLDLALVRFERLVEQSNAEHVLDREAEGHAADPKADYGNSGATNTLIEIKRPRPRT